MKTELLFIITVGVVLSIFSFNYVYAVPPINSEAIYEMSDSIVVGKVIFVNPTFSLNDILYHIEVEKFLKNPKDTNVIFAAGPNTVNPRVGNQIFDVGDRALFFLRNTSIYDQDSEVFLVHYESALVKPGWDDCNIFNSNIPKEHWVLGGRGPMLKVQQENSTNDNDFVIGKEVMITYDMFNHTPEEQSIPFGMTIMNKDDPDSLYIFTETTSLQLEPCVPYQTLTWSFTPSEYGYYAAEFNNLMSSRTTVGFTIEESKPDDNDPLPDTNFQSTNDGSVSLDRTIFPAPWERGPPLKQFKDGFAIDEIYCKGDLELIQKYNGSPACVTPRTAEELIKRGWTIYDVPNTFDYVIEAEGVTYGSQYEISGGTVDKIVYDEHRNSLIISLNGVKQGYLQLVIQTGLLHSPRELPFNYIVIEDGEEIEFEQLSPIILKIQFEKETKQIEIVGVAEI